MCRMHAEKLIFRFFSQLFEDSIGTRRPSPVARRTPPLFHLQWKAAPAAGIQLAQKRFRALYGFQHAASQPQAALFGRQISIIPMTAQCLRHMVQHDAGRDRKVETLGKSVQRDGECGIDSIDGFFGKDPSARFRTTPPAAAQNRNPQTLQGPRASSTLVFPTSEGGATAA